VKIFTLSFDDGHPEDILAAETMLKHKIRGTFYPNFCRIYKWHKKIHQELEVGSHGMTHDNPLEMNPKELREFLQRKPFEDFLEKEIRMFAYPWGFHNKEIIKAVKHEGYIGSRIGDSEDEKTYSLSKNPYKMRPTMFVGEIPTFEEFKEPYDQFLKLKEGVFHMATHVRALKDFEKICKYIKNSGVDSLTNSELILKEKNGG